MVYEDASAAAAAADTAADDDSALNAVYILPLLILSYAIYIYLYTFVVRFLPFSPLGYDDDDDEYR